MVKPAVQGGNLGFKYSTDGIWPARLDGTAIGEPARAPLRVQWHGIGEHVWVLEALRREVRRVSVHPGDGHPEDRHRLVGRVLEVQRRGQRHARRGHRGRGATGERDGQRAAARGGGHDEQDT